MKRKLNNREGRRVAVIENDVSEVNIDADRVRADTEISRADETLVETSNGCICCPLRADLLAEVRSLGGERHLDYLLRSPQAFNSHYRSQRLSISATSMTKAFRMFRLGTLW